MHTRLVVLLCSVLWIRSFCSHHGSKLCLNVLKIQPLLLRTLTFHMFPIHHKHCSWVFSYPLALRPTPQNATSYHLTSYCAYRNRDCYTLPRCGGWGMLSLLGLHLSFSKMTRPHTLDLQSCSGTVKAQMFV